MTIYDKFTASSQRQNAENRSTTLQATGIGMYWHHCSHWRHVVCRTVDKRN